MNKKVTGREIKAFRESIGMNQTEFAKQLGFKKYGWLSAIENGRAKISEQTQKIFEQLVKDKNIDK